MDQWDYQDLKTWILNNVPITVDTDNALIYWARDELDEQVLDRFEELLPRGDPNLPKPCKNNHV